MRSGRSLRVLVQQLDKSIADGLELREQINDALSAQNNGGVPADGQMLGKRLTRPIRLRAGCSLRLLRHGVLDRSDGSLAWSGLLTSSVEHPGTISGSVS